MMEVLPISQMVPNQTVLCLSHLIDSARNHERPTSTATEQAKTATPKKPTPERRIQPSRRAKNKIVSYDESSDESSSSGKGNLLTQKEASRKLSGGKKSTARSIAALEKRARAVAAALEKVEGACIYGPRPWSCHQCNEIQMSEARESTRSKTRSRGNKAPMMEMKVGPRGKLLKDWNTAPLPGRYQFAWEGLKFAVDSCEGIKVVRV